MVWTAYCEYMAAKEIGKIMRKAFDQPDPSGCIKRLKTTLDGLIRDVFDASKWVGTKTGLIKQAEQILRAIDVELDPKFRRHLWTQAHSFYATMGGFVVEAHGLEQNYLPEAQQRMTLTPEGLKMIAKHCPQILPDLPESAIVDKSKANSFTKLVTCAQALWFGVQCVTRSAQGLSISLLEINTAVHAMCTLLVYFLFWWDKPLDVEDPTIFTNVDTHPVMAFLLICDKFPQAHLSPIDLGDDEHSDPVLDSEDTFTLPFLRHILLRQSKDPQFPSPGHLVYHGFAIPTNRTKSDPALWKPARWNPAVQDLNDVDFQRFKLASEAAKKYELRHTQSRMDFLKVRLHNRPDLFDSDSATNYKSYIVGFPLAGLLYGSFHLIVWNRSFRGDMDELLWKVSSLTILVSGIPFLIGLCWLILSGELVTGSRRIERYLWYPITCLYFVCFALVYIFCRTFIIVECFLDVFHLPDSAFEVPQWSQYFPHIG